MDVKKRTTLIIILLIALFMLWDNWVVYNGGSSLIFSYRSTDKKEEAKTAEPAGLPMEKVTKANEEAEKTKKEEAKRQALSDVITVQTDVFKLAINANGGVFQNLELLKYPDNDFQKDMVLFENNPPRVYLAQTGLSGGLYPNH
ncbi:MAG: membrane protein insertase YidC, partial [Oxalobacter sp.]|nr:membrane protein insertase YidC [Oxalobacter sp.]